MSEGAATTRCFQFTTGGVLAAVAWMSVCFGSAFLLSAAMRDATAEVLVFVTVESLFLAVGALLHRAKWLAIVGLFAWVLFRPALLPPYF